MTASYEHVNKLAKIDKLAVRLGREKRPHHLAVSRFLQVLSCHIPFLVSSVEDFKDHIPRETDMKVKHT